MSISLIRARRIAPETFLWGALLLPAHAATATVSVVISGRTLSGTVAPFVGAGGTVYTPIETVRLLGGRYRLNPVASTVAVTGAGGQTVTVPDIRQAGHDYFPLQAAAAALGADVDWQDATQTLTLRARLEMVRQTSNGLSIFTSYPVPYHVQSLEAPDRVFVDLDGLYLAAAPVTVPVIADGPQDNVERIRSGQIDFNTVRITVDLRHGVPFRVVSGPQADRIQVALGEDGSSPGRPPDAATQTPGPAPALKPLPVTPAAEEPNPAAMPAPLPPDVHITGVALHRMDSGVTQIVVTTTGPAHYQMETLRSPRRLAFSLSGADLIPSVIPNLSGDGSLVKAVRADFLHAGDTRFGRVMVDLSRDVVFSVAQRHGADGGVQYLISLQTMRPAASSTRNSLRSMTVVVDPGHGAQDSGALAPDGSMEKTFTLAIGRRLRDVLTRAGATVFLTRSDDTFLPVMARPRVAIAHGADFYISIHCDSSGPRNSRSGTTVYYHAQDAICHRMASDILNRVAEVSGLPPAGTRSDTVRFQGGFGVLRGSPMPAVLVECGYMNSDADLVKLKQDATQQHIAEGIAAGLRDFIADRAARN